MKGTRESVILRSRIREIITEINRVPGCPLTRIYEEIDLLSHEKHQAYRLSSIQEAVGLLFSYCTGMKITSEAKLPIYQKSSVAHRIMWHP